MHFSLLGPLSYENIFLRVNQIPSTSYIMTFKSVYIVISYCNLYSCHTTINAIDF